MTIWTNYVTTLILNFIFMFIFCWLSVMFSLKIYANTSVAPARKIIVSLVGSVICAYLNTVTTIDLFQIAIYICFSLAYLYLFGKQEWKVTIFLSNAYLLNIMTIRMLVTCVIALIADTNIAKVAYRNPMLSELAILTTLLILIVFLIVMLRIVPNEQIYHITQISELRRGMNLFMGLSNLYLLMQSTDYSFPGYTGFTLFRNLISICVLLLIANWAFLIYNLKLLKLLNVKTENQKMQTEMEKLNVAATTDGLTGVSNKMTAIEAIERELVNGGAFFVIDVDNFKSINDTLGHNMGDLLLKELSKSIRSVFRDEDIVGRFGGDEFLVFMTNHHITRTAVENKADVLCHTVQKKLDSLTNASVSSSISVGILLIPGGKDLHFDAAFKLADDALYESKEKGKNTYTIYVQN